MNSPDTKLREFERNQDSFQYKLLRKRLGYGEVLPTESSPKIFNDTELFFKEKIRIEFIDGRGYSREGSDPIEGPDNTIVGSGLAAGVEWIDGGGWEYQFKYSEDCLGDGAGSSKGLDY